MRRVKDDASLEATVERETYEEIGIPSTQLKLLGQIGPVQRSLAGNPVFPFVVRLILDR